MPSEKFLPVHWTFAEKMASKTLEYLSLLQQSLIDQEECQVFTDEALFLFLFLSRPMLCDGIIHKFVNTKILRCCCKTLLATLPPPTPVSFSPPSTSVPVRLGTSPK